MNESENIFKIEQFKKELIRIRPVADVCKLVVNFLKNRFGAERIGIYLWDESYGAFYVWPKQDIKGAVLRIYEPVLDLFAGQDRILFRDRDHSFSPEEKEMLQGFFAGCEGKVAIPLILNRSPVGIIFADFKTEPSEDLLQQIEEARGLAVMALSNSILYERLEGLLAGMEEKIQQRNKELERAQGRLLESEKMATLGVLTAGIAHEVNTPAAVIQGGVENLEQNLSYVLLHVEDTTMHLSTGQRQDLAWILKRISLSLAVGRHRGIRDSYHRKKYLREMLNAVGIPHASELATLYTETGLFKKKDYENNSEMYLASPLIKRTRSLFLNAEVDVCKELVRFMNETTGCARNILNIDRSVRSIVRIVGSLKQYSRSETGEMKPHDIHDGLENAVILLSNLMKGRIQIDYRYGDLPPVICDADALNQVWTNLIMNALQVLDDVPAPVIRIRTELRNLDGREAVRIAIADNGPGMIPALLTRIWDPFFTTKDQGEGSGLGLGIVRGIVERHGGRVEVVSEPGKGAEFVVYLPTGRDEIAQVSIPVM